MRSELRSPISQFTAAFHWISLALNERVLEPTGDKSYFGVISVSYWNRCTVMNYNYSSLMYMFNNSEEKRGARFNYFQVVLSYLAVKDGVAVGVREMWSAPGTNHMMELRGCQHCSHPGLAGLRHAAAGQKETVVAKERWAGKPLVLAVARADVHLHVHPYPCAETDFSSLWQQTLYNPEVMCGMMMSSHHHHIPGLPRSALCHPQQHC